MLSSITDRELIARLEQLRGHERDAALELLHHLNEVERRNLYLRLGYSSLFTYCVGHLCYSESDAGRRVQAARCLHRFPRVATLLQSGEINMVTLGLVANIVTESTIDQWLERIRGKSQREVEALAATVRAPITLRDRARLVNVVVPVTAPCRWRPPPGRTGRSLIALNRRFLFSRPHNLSWQTSLSPSPRRRPRGSILSSSRNRACISSFWPINPS